MLHEEQTQLDRIESMLSKLLGEEQPRPTVLRDDLRRQQALARKAKKRGCFNDFANAATASPHPAQGERPNG